MSAWIVDKVHIDLLVEAATRPGPDGSIHYRDSAGEWKGTDRASRDEIGQMLVDEIVKSVSYRYPSDDVEAGELPGPGDPYYLKPYQYENRQYPLTPGEVIEAVACYQYQACEHPDWETSAAHNFTEALFRKAAKTFAEGPWGWDEEALADKPKSISILDMMG